MAFTMVELPYEKDALEPYISAETMEYHYGKHYKTYVDNVNKLIAGTDYDNMTLDEIIRSTAGKADLAPVFNNAAQAWNHAFFWQSMKPDGGGNPNAELKLRIEHDFGSLEKFKEEFKAAAISQFGSGWAWLAEKDGHLAVIKTSNADTPIAHESRPLLTLDVWEHAYYLDYQNRRADFATAFLDHLVNW